MRRFLRLLILLASLAVATRASAQDTLNLNQTYRDVIRLHFPAGKTQIPLPEGNWELLGLLDDTSPNLNTRVWRGFGLEVSGFFWFGWVGERKLGKLDQFCRM